jgi:hypothetical protein
MRVPRIGRFAVGTIAFFAGLGVTFFGSRVYRAHFYGTRSSVRKEEMRIIDPDAPFDAVVIGDYYGGAMGGIDWSIYIVPRGKTVSDQQKPVFEASTLDGEKLVWRERHVLEVHYDLASIEGFRNVWCSDEIQRVSGPESDYCIEIRLAPPNGDPEFAVPKFSSRD